jgi:ferredoxin
LTHVVNGNCRNCRYTDCAATCPVACFHVDDVRAYIDPKVCIDCGACVPACPVHAIVEEFDLPESERHWLEINAESAQRLPALRAKLPPLPGADERRRELGY